MSNGSPGWVPTKYVRPVDNRPPPKPAPPPEPEAAAPPASDSEPAAAAPQEQEKTTPAPPPRAHQIITTTRTNIRTEPNLESDVKYIEAAGVRHTVHETRGEWFKIRTREGDFGWIHESVVRILSYETP
jgi:uncharacterized protein YgiM (DUF1202 family)